MWLSVIALIIGLLSACISVWSYMDSSQRPKREELRSLLERYSQELSKKSEQQLKAIETEWDDMYQKFSRLTGRMDRQKAIEKAAEPRPVPEPPVLSRSDLVRKHKGVIRHE